MHNPEHRALPKGVRYLLTYLPAYPFPLAGLLMAPPTVSSHGGSRPLNCRGQAAVNLVGVLKPLNCGSSPGYRGDTDFDFRVSGCACEKQRIQRYTCSAYFMISYSFTGPPDFIRDHIARLNTSTSPMRSRFPCRQGRENHEVCTCYCGHHRDAEDHGDAEGPCLRAVSDGVSDGVLASLSRIPTPILAGPFPCSRQEA